MKNKNLQGKWLIRDISHNNGKKGFPGFQLIEIEEEKVIFHRDFSLKNPELQLKLGNLSFLNSKDEIAHEFTVVNENQIIIYFEGTSNDIEVTFECNFDRLVPTITPLKIEEIESFVYKIKVENSEEEFIFNKELSNQETLELQKIKEGKKYRIEQIDQTLFISSYYNSKREVSYPIKEVTEKLIKLYPFPMLGKEFVGYRKH